MIQQEVVIDHGKVVSKTTKDEVLEQVREECAEEEPDCEDESTVKPKV